MLYAVPGQGERFYLLLHHRSGGHWGFPKGRIEEEEAEEEAALREAHEETGIEKITLVPGFRKVSSYTFMRDKESVAKKVVYLLGRVADRDVVLSKEHTDWLWLPYAPAWGRLTYKDTREVLCAADRYLSGAKLPQYG